LDARLTTFLRKRVTVPKSNEVKTGSNLVEPSREGYGSKSAVLPTVMMMYCYYTRASCTVVSILHTSVTSPTLLADQHLPSVTRSICKTPRDRTSFLCELSPAIKSLDPDVPIHPYSLPDREGKGEAGKTKN
jgi:hypothetical protein